MTTAQCPCLLPLGVGAGAQVLVLVLRCCCRREDDRKRHHSGPIQASYARYARPRDFSTVVLRPFLLLLAPWEAKAPTVGGQSVGMQQSWEVGGGRVEHVPTD